MNLLYIDLFCGAGGVTTGISQVPGVHVVACVNHDADAIASHAANHPRTLHYTEDIRTLDTAPDQRPGKSAGHGIPRGLPPLRHADPAAEMDWKCR